MIPSAVPTEGRRDHGRRGNHPRWRDRGMVCRVGELGLRPLSPPTWKDG
jgi:hypothetical protein